MKQTQSIAQITIVILTILIGSLLFTGQVATETEAAPSGSEWEFLYCETYGTWQVCYEPNPTPWNDPSSTVWCVEHGTC